MADRYCGNCGHELAEDDRFCRNCGTPVHRAAVLPTPEADVPTPPPPQGAQETSEQTFLQRWWPYLAVLAVIVLIIASLPAGGGGGGGQQAANLPPERAEQPPKLDVSSPSESTTVDIDTYTYTVKGKVTPADADVSVNGASVATDSDGSFSNVISLARGENEIEITAVNGSERVDYSRVITRGTPAELKAAQEEEKRAAEQAAEGQQEQQAEPQAQPQPPREYAVGQTATVGNVEWTVTDAYLTNQLRSGFGTQKRGRFVVVDFTFTNNRPEEVTLDPQLHMVLKDSQGREFGPDPDAWEFVPVDLDIFLEPVNPGVSTNGRVVYQVAPDATGFTLTVDDVEFWEDKSAVFDLSNIGPRTYDTASPTATATAGQ